MALFFTKGEYNMIDYVVSDDVETFIYANRKNVKIDSITRFLNRFAEINLFGIDGYRKAVSKIFKIKKDIPIYFDKKNIYLFFRDSKRYMINYKAILSIGNVNEKAVINFLSGEILFLSKKFNFISERIKKVEKIIQYKELDCYM